MVSMLRYEPPLSGKTVINRGGTDMKQMGMLGCLLMIVCIFFLAVGTPTYAEPQTINGKTKASVQKVQLFNDVLHKHGVKMSSWSIFIREEPKTINDLGAFKKRVRQLKKTDTSIQWDKISETTGFYSFTGKTKGLKDQPQSHLTLFAYPHKDKYQTYLIYEISGSKWDSKTAVAIERQIDLYLSKIQHQSMTFYTCMVAHDGATMNHSLSTQVNELMHDLNARPVEKVAEKTFISVSAYTDYWKDSLTTGNKCMNVQVAVRKTGSVTTVIMGTPIITIAY